MHLILREQCQHAILYIRLYHVMQYDDKEIQVILKPTFLDRVYA